MTFNLKTYVYYEQARQQWLRKDQTIVEKLIQDSPVLIEIYNLI